MEFLEENNLVYFSFDKITTYIKKETGEEKKKLNGMPAGWEKINQETKYINSEHSAYGIITGATSNITVVDFDNINTYNMLIQTFPELDKCCKVKTRNGYHLYFKYNPNLNNTTDVGRLPGIDIRNDGGFVIGPKTTYKTLDGEKHKYKLIKGEIMEIPQTLLTQFEEKAFKPKPKEEDPITKKPQIKKQNEMPASGELEEIIEEMKKLLYLLTNDYYDNYDLWRNVGFIINNELGKDGYELYDEFSKPSKKYNEDEVRKFYFNIDKKEDGLKIGTLHMWAKECNEEEYNKLFPKKIKENKLINNLIDCFNHANVAEYYIKHFETENDYKYIYDSNLWYSYYPNNVLSEEGNAHSPTQLFNDIKINITKDLEEKLKNVSLELLNLDIEKSKAKGTDKEEIEKKIEIKKKLLINIKTHIKTIGTSSFIKGTIDFIKNYYLVDKLQEKINNNINILAFNDMVFDFTIKDFRPIKKLDFVTFTTKYDAPKISKPEIRKELNELLLSVFNTEEMRKYWMQTVAMAMFTTKYESVYIHTGSGGNGKGLLFNLLSHCLGDYYKQANNEFLTTKFKSDAPNSELANAKGKRFFVVSEPSAGDGNNKQAESKLNVDFIKFLSGNDKIACRDLYSKAKSEFKAQFTIFLQCNLKPKLSKNDKGIFRRLKIIDYPNEFVDKPNPKKPNQKQINVNLKTKLEKQDYINEFMLMLLEIAKEEKIEEPEQIKQAVEEYKEDNDPVKGWLLENFEITNEDLSPKERIRTSDLYNEFPEKQNLTASSFKQYLIMNDVKVKISSGINYAFNLKKIVKEEVNDLDN